MAECEVTVAEQSPKTESIEELKAALAAERAAHAATQAKLSDVRGMNEELRIKNTRLEEQRDSAVEYAKKLATDVTGIVQSGLVDMFRRVCEVSGQIPAFEPSIRPPELEALKALSDHFSAPNGSLLPEQNKFFERVDGFLRVIASVTGRELKTGKLETTHNFPSMHDSRERTDTAHEMVWVLGDKKLNLLVCDQSWWLALGHHSSLRYCREYENTKTWGRLLNGSLCCLKGVAAEQWCFHGLEPAVVFPIIVDRTVTPDQMPLVERALAAMGHPIAPKPAVPNPPQK